MLFAQVDYCSWQVPMKTAFLVWTAIVGDPGKDSKAPSSFPLPQLSATILDLQGWWTGAKQVKNTRAWSITGTTYSNSTQFFVPLPRLAHKLSSEFFFGSAKKPQKTGTGNEKQRTFEKVCAPPYKWHRNIPASFGFTLDWNPSRTG